MKILYYGGQKSGKSSLAEKHILQLSKNSKPFYIATYDNSYNDPEMERRIDTHIARRGELFNTIEEPKKLNKVIKENSSYIVDCISMWILNNLETNENELFNQLDDIAEKDANIVFVLNNVTEGVIPMDKTSRKFVDLTGVIGQRLAQLCDEVYEVKLGIPRRLK